MNDASNCYDPNKNPSLLSVEQTLENIKKGISPLSNTIVLPIRDALGHVLAEEVVSTINVPPHRNSAMDGYAIKYSDINNDPDVLLNIVGKSFAGEPYNGEVNSGECVRIMTGAVMPADCDTVIMQEQTDRQDDAITVTGSHQAEENVRFPGEDIKQGAVILQPGKKISPADLGLLSSIGISDITVYCKPKVAFFSFCDELKSLGEKLGPGDIYHSNRYTLYGMLKQMDVEIIDLGVIADKKELIKQTLIDAAEKADMVLTSGGASVGEADYISEILNEIGAVNFWKIAMKPGKPLAFGHINQTPFFGLPGNPVSVMATCYLFVQPAIQSLKGISKADQMKLTAKLENNLKKAPGRTDFQRGIFTQLENGELSVSTTGMQGSHILTSMSLANCFIVLPRDFGNVSEGEWVEILPFNDIL